MPFVDTNIFLRYLTKDDPDKAQACFELFKRAEANQIT
jgi:predicted nucleic acid-binding protein